MAYKEPINFKQVGDEILTNFGQEVELKERKILGDIVDEEGVPTGEQGQIPNPEFTKCRNANSRIWLKNGKTLRILAEIDGVVDKDNPLAVASSSCEKLELQPFYVRIRVEEPTINIPTDPALEIPIEEID